MLLLLVALICQPNEHVDSRKIVIVYDDSRNSKCLVSELTRDWSKASTGESIKSPLVASIVSLQSELKPKIELVHKSKLGIWRDEEFPRWKYGEYGKLEPFDDRMFICSGMPLLTLHSIASNQTVDLTSWRQKCLDLTEEHNRAFCRSALSWLKVNKPVEFEKIENDTAVEYAGYCPLEYRFEASELVDRFGKFRGFPELTAPKLPESPMRLMPWEVGYTLPFPVVESK